LWKHFNSVSIHIKLSLLRFTVMNLDAGCVSTRETWEWSESVDARGGVFFHVVVLFLLVFEQGVISMLPDCTLRSITNKWVELQLHRYSPCFSQRHTWRREAC